MLQYGDKYIKHLKDIIDKIIESQHYNIEKAAIKLANAVEAGNTIFAFGCSHSGIIVEELFYRTGGFALINPIFNPTLMLNTRPVTMTSRAERIERFGTEIIDQSPLSEGDVILIHSVSGRNPVVVDAAMEAKKKGAYVIGLTNMTYSTQVKSRHNTGKKLYDIADLVIDNCGDFEDSCMKIEGIDQKIAPTSTVAGAAIVNSIVVETSAILLSRGIEPPIFHSANVDGGDEFNKKIFEKYKDRIFYL
jgi:uncharacterized phosphosugar-binding protein